MPPDATFRPAWWLPSPHLQTLWAALIRRPPPVQLTRERLELPDGDFIDLDWTAPGEGALVLVLHGLEGSSRSRYARALLAAVTAQGWQGVVMHFRGCSGEPNRLPRSYHSGETGDLEAVLRLLQGRRPQRAVAVVGYSLGGNVLLKWLGERRDQAGVACAVAVSVPFDLAAAARRLNIGLSKGYQWKLLKSLKRTTRRKAAAGTLPPGLSHLQGVDDFWTFDDRVTAPLHGFAGADDYYSRSSSRQYLAAITVPTLVLHARDDPFLFPEVTPDPAEVAAAVELEVYGAGGHVGFVAGPWPWRAEYWLEPRITRFIAERL